MQTRYKSILIIEVRNDYGYGIQPGGLALAQRGEYQSKAGQLGWLRHGDFDLNPERRRRDDMKEAMAR